MEYRSRIHSGFCVWLRAHSRYGSRLCGVDCESVMKYQLWKRLTLSVVRFCVEGYWRVEMR